MTWSPSGSGRHQSRIPDDEVRRLDHLFCQVDDGGRPVDRVDGARRRAGCPPAGDGEGVPLRQDDFDGVVPREDAAEEVEPFTGVGERLRRRDPLPRGVLEVDDDTAHAPLTGVLHAVRVGIQKDRPSDRADGLFFSCTRPGRDCGACDRTEDER